MEGSIHISEFEKKYWGYYLVLEKSVLDTEPYVAFSESNFNCYSNEFIKIYQAICSEIDVLLKEYYKFLKNEIGIMHEARGKIDIKLYAKYIKTRHPSVYTYKVYLKDSNYEFKPWKNWENDISPEWWTKYNAVKHRRTGKDNEGKYNYEAANLGNVLYSLAALFMLMNIFYSDYYHKSNAYEQLRYYNSHISQLFAF